MLRKIVCALALAAIACAAQAADRKLADTLTVAQSTEPSNLLPYNNSQYYASTIENMIFNNLIYRGRDGNFIPGLAKSWEYVADDTVRFHLHDGVTFSTGDPLTAEDVKFTFERGNTSSMTLYYNTIKEVRVVDRLTVDVQTTSANVALLSNLAQTRSAIVSKAAVEKFGEASQDRMPVGSGPFRLVQWVAGSEIRLERREDYWGPKPAFKNLIFKFITETANRSIELETDAVDIALEPDPNDLDRLRELGFNVVTGPSYTVSQFLVNYSRVPDEKLRQAFGYAVNTPALVEAIYGEMATPSRGFLPMLMSAYEDNVQYSYDVAKARQLVAESSYKGEEIEVVLQNLNELRDIAEALQYYWRQVGINARITMLDVGAARARENAGENMVYVSTANWLTGDPSRPLSVYARQGGNRYGVPPAELARMHDYFDKGLTIQDEKARDQHYREFQNFINSLWIIFPIAQKKVAYAMTKNVEGFYPWPSGSPEFHELVVYE